LLTSGPTWLIDVWDKCVVQGSNAESYIALSYVWGNIPFIHTTRSNLEYMKTCNVLSGDNPEFVVPQTIGSAMFLTGMLKERYLWVDSLCIVQDDGFQKYSDIKDMFTELELGRLEWHDRVFIMAEF
jgi:hypothetical protein